MTERPAAGPPTETSQNGAPARTGRSRRPVVQDLSPRGERAHAERDLAGQYAVGRVLAVSDSLEEAAPRIVEAVCETLGWEFGAVWLRDRRAAVLHCVGVWHVPWIDARPFEEETRRMRFARGEGLPGSVWAAMNPLWAEEFARYPHATRVAQASRAGLRSAFGVPIALGNDLLGVMEFFSRDLRPPDDDLLAMLSALGRQIGQFIQRKEAEADIRRLAWIVESSEDAIIGKTLDGVITSWNRGARRIYGYTEAEVIGRHISLLAPAERRDQLEDFMGQLRRGEQVEKVETVRVRKDGTRIHVELTISPIRDIHGTLIGGSTIARDITERKRAEDERSRLLGAERSARRAAEAARERLMFLADATSMLASSLDYATTLNRLAELCVSRMADWCLVEMIQDEGVLAPVAFSHRDPSQSASVRELVDRIPSEPLRPMGPAAVVRTGRAELYPEVTAELLAQAAGEETTLDALRGMNLRSVMIVPLLAHGVAMGAITFVSSDPETKYGPDDLALAEELARSAALAVDNAHLYSKAERLNVELEQRVAERTAELEASNRELEAFSYSVSHDLRAPLRAIDGFSRILLKDFGSQIPDEAREHLEIVREGAQQMGRLIDDLLTFARLGRQSLSKQTIEPTHIVRRVLEQLRTDMEGRDVEMNIGDLPRVQADPALLHQVYVNLLANALKFTRTRSPAVIEVGSTDRDGHAVYFVRDNGVGFDMRYADKLFGVFQRMHRAEDYEGTGVGLAIVQRVVHRHGGQVWAEAEPEKGAAFYFTLDGSLADR